MWIILFLCLVINTYIFDKITNKTLSLVNSFITLFGYLTGQGPHKDIRYYCKNITKLNSLIFITQVVIWLFASLILSLSFNGLLLNTFFFIKSTPVVNTLEDIRDNKKLLIDGPHQYPQDVAKMNEFDIDDILFRIKQNEIYFPTIKKLLNT